ncbi:MAG: hypothetical protein CL814_11685 [Confluentimicrobium sp.]|jgi:DNA-binding MurR/RpiR family transcriptional regulator|uniref:MurR/RpiR family transcriptional regulator n=1 Tax=Actibacterium sp. TaxID=1872125 RepID=UPI000C6878C0|nr:MurR/RpiR family transcriptional regulator [Actibacterium sp.]MBC57578.1 hypothetical protein [Actibacterium sp.]MDY6859999.1 MurR/RpiR family transcriptional regulator [Pseudomonadota bacterium]|tara:strand:+ start:1030 stop:1911 length:882 start_codon:yes stop_codon:yes gene_type:complete
MSEKPPKDAPPRSIERRIKAIYESIPASERVLADRVLEYPSDVLMCSATELAELAGASKAAVTRFVKRLEYSDFREMQREIRRAQSTGDPIFLNAGRSQREGESNALLVHLDQDMSCLRQTIEQLDQEVLIAIARRIVTARRVACLGYRNSYFFAAYMRRQIIQIRPDAMILPLPGQTLMEDLGQFGPDDLLIAVGLRRRPPELGRAMQLMQQAGVPIAYVTDRRAITSTKFAQWVVPCQVRGTSLFDSYVGVISVLNFICTRAVVLSGATGRKRLNDLEEMIELLGELDPKN